MRLRVPSIQTPTWFRDAANAINLLLGDIPEGGTTNQALVKSSDDDWDLEWASFASTGHVHAASVITFAPAGSIAATDVQAAIAELDTEKAAASHTHAIADVTGLQAALDAKLDDTQASAFGLTLLDDADAATARTTLGLAIGTDVQAYDADLTTWAGITPAAGIADFLATPSSANLIAAVTDETGTGSLVFSTSPTFTGTITAAAATFSGAVNANAGIITTSLYIQGSNPEATLKDTDTAGNSATMYFAGRDSANAVQWRVGRPFTTVLRFENLGGSFGWYNALGAGQMMLLNSSALNIASGTAYQINGTQVVQARITGWAAASGTATRTTFDTATVTTAQLAERVKALIDDLRTHGLIGT